MLLSQYAGRRGQQKMPPLGEMVGAPNSLERASCEGLSDVDVGVDVEKTLGRTR